MSKWTRRDTLIEDEKYIQSNWNFTSEINREQKKCFVTFPFPYQNGRLHLGHAYTISKVEFYARFMKLQGYNVLFPFGYHGTGTPIVACANKLKLALDAGDLNNIDTLPHDNQIVILHNMGISKEEIPKFVDPYYWIKYFPQITQTDLQNFGVCVDYNRSFVTTDLNPYFDQFIKWQFHNLNVDNYLTFGKKPVIYSPKDKQPCSDHDRSKGEGVGIKEFNAYYSPFSEEGLISFEMDGKSYAAPARIVRNLKYQKDITEKTRSDDDIIVANTGDRVAFTYYEPESEVISRSGDVCVCAIIDQWFLNYEDETIATMINQYINSTDFHANDELKTMLTTASNWIKQWPCSRSNGLGTQLLNSEFIIDSLSDSTIYMAFYTIAHKITQIPIDMLSTNVFEYIFKNGPMPDNVDNKLLRELKEEFLYWYPLDLRVSGKDLINNHLIMSLYNHAMIWKNEKMFPKNYVVNGHLLLNGKKMSKSEGNFMTLADALQLYGADATRIALAEAGSGQTDANFVEQKANAAVLRLTTEKEWCFELVDRLVLEKNAEVTFWDQIFREEIHQCLIESQGFYKELEYQKAITSSFYQMSSIRDSYRSKYESKLIPFNDKSMMLYLEVFLLLSYPIVPHFVETIWNYASDKGLLLNKQWISDIKINNKLIFMRDLLVGTISTIRSDIAATIKKQKKEKCNVTVTIFNNLTDKELDIINMVKNNENVVEKYGKTVMKTVNLIQKYVTKYGIEWFDFSLDEYCIICQEWIKKICAADKNITNLEINIQAKKKDYDLYKSIIQVK